MQQKSSASPRRFPRRILVVEFAHPEPPANQPVPPLRFHRQWEFPQSAVGIHVPFYDGDNHELGTAACKKGNLVPGSAASLDRIEYPLALSMELRQKAVARKALAHLTRYGWSPYEETLIPLSLPLLAAAE